MAQKNKPKLILFDIGGVIHEYQHVFETAAKELGISSAIFNDTFDKYDEQITKGFISPQDLYRFVRDEYKLDTPSDYDFMRSWVHDFEIKKPTYELILELASSYQLGLFSNIYKGMVEDFQQTGLIPRVEYIVQAVSCNIGMQKPDADIYDYVETVSGLQGEQLLFVDDKQENTDVAKNRGWQVHTFNRFDAKSSVQKLSDQLLL
jgi:FMN phosphatase YigB (HAD superfamily)